MGKTYFSTSATIDVSFPEWGYQFSGTGPFLVDAGHMPFLYDELTAAGCTVTQWTQDEFFIEANATVGEWPIMNPRTSIVVSAVKIIPIANYVGATDNYDVWNLIEVSTTPATIATVASWSNTVGTVLAFTKQAFTMGTVSGAATIAANSILDLVKSTVGTGIDNGKLIFQIEWYEP